MKIACTTILLFFAGLGGCFDSLVTGHCEDGFVVCGNSCVRAEACAADAGPTDAPDAPEASAPDAAETSTPDAAAVPDAGPICPLDRVACAAGCTDITADVDNCGACGTACGDSHTCSNGSCCGATELGCRGSCIDPSSDPDNCGACGIGCSSGICQDGICAGMPVGHLVVIGHDFVTNRVGMNRLVGNAIFLARVPEVSVATYAIGAVPAGVTGANQAIDQVAKEIGRTWKNLPTDSAALSTDLAQVDVVLLYAQADASATSLDALAESWKPALSSFLARGGVAVVLEGNGGETHRLVGDLFTCTSREIATGQTLTVDALRDAVAAAVPASYWAEADSVAFTGTTAASVVIDVAGNPVVLHQTF